jgi:uncharacterized protein (DUF433 family)
MTKQAIDWSGCELVEVIPGKVSGVPLLKGTRLPADTIVENAAGGLSVAEISDLFDVPQDQARAILDYAARQQQATRKRRRGLSPVGS